MVAVCDTGSRPAKFEFALWVVGGPRSAEARHFFVPACYIERVARGGGQDWLPATAGGGLVLTITSTAPRFAVDGPCSLLICCRARMTAWQRAGHEVKALPRRLILAPPLRRPCAPLAPLRSKPPQNGRRPFRPCSTQRRSWSRLLWRLQGCVVPFLAARRLVTGFELEIAQLSGVQRRTTPEVALALCQQIPHQNGELACRRDGGNVLAAPGLKGSSATGPGSALRPSPPRPACRRVPAAFLGDPPTGKPAPVRNASRSGSAGVSRPAARVSRPARYRRSRLSAKARYSGGSGAFRRRV